MGRNTNLNDVFFPVVLAPIYYEPPIRSDQQMVLLDDNQAISKLECVPGYQAVLNKKSGKVFSIVSADYRLVTNEEAYELAKNCFRQVFNTVDTQQMEVFNIITPKSKSFCHIDVVHTGYSLNIWKQEAWLPYLRITNSYNRTHPLRFDLGFCRALCDNGCIFEKMTTKIRFYHSIQQISQVGQFNTDFAKLKELENAFNYYLKRLQNYEISKSLAAPLACKALNIKFNLEEKGGVRINDFQKISNILADKYFSELGENAYAEFNLITDLASRPFFMLNQNGMVDVLQKRAGQWLRSFIQELNRPEFNLRLYLQDELQWFQNN